uniref:Uncharacterized protein n=1 Tax=Strongyloides venezuelensis TaxID=75913 RepID=A0A0K0G358_STRVS
MASFQFHEINQLLIGFTFLSAAIAIFLAFFCYCGAKTCCKARRKESTNSESGVLTKHIKKNTNEPLLTSVSYTSNIESPEIAFIDERITNVVSSTVKVNSLRSS